MAYEVQPIDVINTPKERIIDPRSKKGRPVASNFKWWLADSDKDLCAQLLSTTEYLKNANQNRIRQASVFTRLFSGKPLYNYLASTATLDNSNQLPIGRPTANVCYSCTDTLVSRISQDRPQPTFLTDGGDYKQRRLAKQANAFLQGEFYRTKAYDKAALSLRDSCILGDGLLKVFSLHDKVTLERTLSTELLTDYNDSYYGDPRQLIQLKLVDRDVFMELFPEQEHIIAAATHGNVDTTPRSNQTVSDQFILAEGWRLPSFKGAKDGRHVIACSAGVVLDDRNFDKTRFPFAKIGYNSGVVGWFSQGLIEILMPTQMELYRQLIVASQSLELMGVPRVLIEEASKILETSFNNRIGSIIKYRNIAPQFVNAQANNPEIYQFIQWLISNSYQIAGISAMSAQGTKPAGLNSGESIREFDMIQNDRFAALAKRYQNLFPDLGELMLDCASDIFEETGKYSSTAPTRAGLETIDFKTIKKLDDAYVIQCFEQSSLPKDPAGRQAKLSEMLAAGEVTLPEFRRLSNFPDLEQSDQLANALEERILHDLDSIIDDGKYYAPDPFVLDPTNLATTLAVNYINKYAVTNLEENKMQMLRNYYTQSKGLSDKAMAQLAAAAQQNVPQGTMGNVTQLPVQPPQASVAPTSNVAV